MTVYDFINTYFNILLSLNEVLLGHHPSPFSFFHIFFILTGMNY